MRSTIDSIKANMLRQEMMQRLKYVSNLWLSIPEPQQDAQLRILTLEAGRVKIQTVPSLFGRYGIGNRLPYAGDSWDDLSQDVLLLLSSNPRVVITALKRAGYEIPRAILRAIREFQQKAIRGTSFLEAKIKAIFLPLKLIPKSLHPEKVAA